MATRKEGLHDDETDYGQLFIDFCKAQTKADEEEDRIRVIARNEAEKRIRGWLGIATFIFAAAIWDWQGVLVVVALFIGLVAFDAWEKPRRRGAEKHLIPSKAEDYVRMQITAEAHSAGERCWTVEPKAYERDVKKVVAADSSRWNNADERIYRTALEFTGLSPLERAMRLRAATKDAEAALKESEALARSKDAELTFWAERALHDLTRR